ncbi:hypothetical protein niasHT_007995 [Heterodera trifolii]|uniref:Basement membrane proteoglycan n=1 Tax=Heterodera trifolii TaxID=157864 RepID=A0ABD2M038_9BILA
MGAVRLRFALLFLLFALLFVFISVPSPSFAFHLSTSASSLWRFNNSLATEEKAKTLAHEKEEKDESEGSGEEEGEEEVQKFEEEKEQQKQKGGKEEEKEEETEQTGEEPPQEEEKEGKGEEKKERTEPTGDEPHEPQQQQQPNSEAITANTTKSKMPLQFLAFASPQSVPFSVLFAIFLLLLLPFSSNSTNSTTTIRLSLNLPKQTFSAELSIPDSSAFLEASGAVRAALADIWREESAYRGSSVRRFRYQPTLGSLANVDAHFANVYSGALLHKFRWELERALRTGQIGWLAVSEDGFEFNAIEGPFAKLTLTCPDGALPSFSLHGSTYCWSHSVCPSGTSCVEGQCCKSARSADQLRRCDPLLHWECADNMCIPSVRRCDGIADCKDGATPRDSTDEAYCNSGNEKRSVFGAPEGQCPQGQFRCREDGTCIANEKVCDRKPFDCSDGTDETRCDYYLNNKRAEAEQMAAIAQQQRPRRCAEDEIRCPKVALGRCIHYTKLCDGTDDCGDGSDERNCKSGSERVDADIVVASVSPNELGWGEVSDGPGPTIVTLGGERVIGEIGTEEGSSVGPLIVRPMDPRVIGELRPGENTKGTIGPTPTTSRVIQEIQRSQNTAGTISPLPIGPSSKCGVNQFLCKDGKKCISMTAKCNRHYDCADGSDELDCDYFKQAEERRQQQQKKTKTEEKEQRRTPTEQQQCHLRQGHFFCPISRQCIDQKRKCDGRIDCEHGEDEVNCVTRVKPIDLQINVHPPELSVREGREASFECRARTTDNSFYPEVRWTRVGGRLPDGVREGGGRLTIPQAQLHHAGQYACVAMHNGRTVEAHATLHVQSYGPQELQGDTNAVAAGCMADERACGSNECVKLDYVCDGEPDCRDRSDELNCPAKRLCEPNEFKCKNSRCVQKMWLCDGDDDCGDGSDEKSCGERKHGDLCQATEFSCSNKKQCVPASFQCDGTNDCQDGSDEIGCVQPTVVQPPESNMVVQQGQDFKLTCRAVGVPDPYINWRLNWADVCEPPRCQQVSQGGVGTLSVQNAQPMDQGAYTCEAINVKGRVLATPDCIVRIVSIPAPQAPQPPPPPQPEPQRLACSSQGAYSPYSDARGQCQCKPLTTGSTCAQCVPGAYHLSDRAPQGCLKCFCFGVTDRCHSSGLFRTKQKLFFADDAQGVELSNVQGQTQPGVQFEFEKYGYLTHTEPHFSQTLYWKLPKRFLGNKVTAYGGDFTVQLQYDGQGQIREEPLVVIQGNGVTLVHKPTDQQAQFVPGQPFTISVNTYEQNFEHQNGSPASREDLMMALAGLNLVLIRATHTDDQTSTSLGDTSWEIAVSKDTQDERALEVEQCECPPGYIGTSCEECAEGYERSGQGPYLGHCVPARQPPARPLCDSAGALSAHPQHDGRCDCKPNVVGVTCDRCAPEAFNLSPQNPQGCLRCFCSGVTRVCESSHWRRNRVELDYARGDRDQLEATTSDAHSPYKPPTQPQVYDGSISFNGFYEARGQTLYWSLPQKFLGDKVSAYGGKLRYTFRFSGAGPLNPDADAIIRGNNIQLEYVSRQQVHADRPNSVEVPITELGWRHSNGVSASREQLMMVLADLDALLIKMSYMRECSQASLVSASLETADAYGTGEGALDVEQCQCPAGYIGSSCEDCAPGYSRTGGGPYLGMCEKCECHNHASQCDAEYGACIDCQHNTEGDRCERCKPGFVGDARRGTPYDCRPAPEIAVVRPRCDCHNHSPRGCDSYGRCILCEHNTEGFHCELCKKGFYGDATKGTPWDCTQCPCPGTAECFLDARGQVQCRNCPPGFAGRLCDECAPGYTPGQTADGRKCEPIGKHKPSEVEFVPGPDVPLRVEILQPKQLTIQEGSRAKWTCKIVSAEKPDLVDIQWSKIGEPELPERAQQFGHQLVIDQVQQQDTGHYRCTGRLKGDISTDDATLTIASPQAAPAFVHYPATLPPALPAAPAQMPKPSVTPPHQLVDEGQQAVFTCLTPGYADCEVQWHFQRLGGPLPHGWQQRGNQIIVQSAQQTHAGDYICSVTHQFGTTASDPGRLEIRKPPSVCPPVCHAPPVPAVPAPPPMRPLVEPPEIETDLGSPARFRCWVPGVPGAVLTWRPSHGGPLPSGADQSGGYLDFPSVSQHHPGQYVCAAYDPSRDPIGSRPVDSDNVRLKLRPKKPFQVLVEPPYQIVDEGQPLPRPYRCWVPGYPQAVLKWRPALDEMLPSGVEEQHNGALLNIPRAELRHAGDYICTAYDPHDDPRGERTVDSTPVRLDVRRPSPPLPARARNPPQVEPPYQRVDLGQPARFRCWVPGEPNAHLSWAPARGGSLPAGAVDRSGHLLFDAVAREHADSYICSSIDPETGQILQSPPVRLDVNEPSKKPLVEPTEQTVQQGHPSRIRCWVPDEPRATLRWTARGGRPLPSGAVDDGRGNLNIAQTLPHHQGDYECIYEPREPSQGPQVSEPARIYVSPPPVVPLERKPGEPPRPVATPPQQTVPRGDPARFHCEPNSKTPAQIHWGFESPNGALPSGVSVDGEDILIAAADEATIGEYHCTATNEFGRGHAEPVKLDITDEEEPPTARVEPKVWNGQPGESKQFKCYVTGNPHPTIKWSGPNGDELPEDVVDLGDGVLEIKDAKKEMHDGEYTCTATNPLGEASDSGKVEIGPSIGINIIKEEKPAPARLKMIVGEPLEIKCEAEGEPDPDVEWLHDPGPERGDLPDDYVPITISEQFLRHPSIGLGNSGCYTCRASNDFASVTKGICIEVIEPSGMTTVGILGGSHQWFPADQPAELICAASVSSLVERVEWKRAGGDALPSDASDEEHRGVLRFDPFKPSDHAGEYECNAYRNEEVIATSKVEVHPEGDTRPDLLHVDISPPQVRVVNAGDSIVLDCVVHGRSADEFTYSWSLARGGALIRELGRQSQLLVKSADPSNDYGIYRCEVESEDGETVGQAQAAVSVGFDSENSAVEAKFDGDSQAVLNCPVFVVPGSTVDWQRENDESLPENSNQSGDKLLIEKFDDSTAGIYRCTVHHGQSSVSGFVNAKIFVPDTIIKVLLNVSSESVQVGDQAWLDCVVIGDPNARVNFSKDGEALPANAQVTANRLLFTSISVEHTGRYRCQAQTKDGVLETSALLNVEGGEETEAEKRRRSFHQQKQQQKTEQEEEEGTPAEEETEEEEKGPQYTLAEGQSAAESDADTVQAVEIGRPEPDHPQRMRRLRRLRQQRRRATSHRKRTQHKEEEEEGKKKQRTRKRTEHAQHKRKKSIAEVRKENLRRRAERYRNGRTQFQKYYHHYEIRNDAPPAALHRARLTTEKPLPSTIEPGLKLGEFVDIEVEREKPREGAVGVVGPDQMLRTEERRGENLEEGKGTIEEEIKKEEEPEEGEGMEEGEGTERGEGAEQWHADTAQFRHFSGTTAMAVPSERAMRLDALDLELQIRPQSPNGIILFASAADQRRAGDERPFMHSVELENGIVTYKFSLGGDRFETIKSRDKVPLNEPTTIRVQNDGLGKASLQVGTSAPPLRLSYPVDRRFAYPPNASSRVFIGGMDPTRAKHFPKMINFIGSIGNLKINGKRVNIGEEGREQSAEGQPIDGGKQHGTTTLDQSENQCANEPCRNGGKCQLTRWGFECHCLAGYAGHLCQLPSTDGICPGGQRLCDRGVCVLATDDGPNAEQCLCPPGWKGTRCETETDQLLEEEEEGQQTKGIRFDGRQSFLALPLGFGVEEGSQKAPGPYSIELRLSSDRQKQQQMIGAMVSTKGKVINAIGIEEEKFWVIHREGDDQLFDKHFLTKRTKHKKTHHLRIEPSDSTNAMNILVDGRKKGVLRGEPGTDGILLLGAMPPRGVIVPDEMYALMDGIVPFEGCVEELLLNGRVLGLAELSRDLYTGVNLGSCAEGERSTSTTTTTTTPLPTAYHEDQMEEQEEPSPTTDFDYLSSTIPPSTTPITVLRASEDPNLAIQNVREGPLVDVVGTTEAFPDEIWTTDSPLAFHTTTSETVQTTTSAPTPDPTTIVPAPRRFLSPIRQHPSVTPEPNIPSSFVPRPADYSVEIEGPFAGLCDDGTCGTHGECEEVNGTHVMCECRDYYVGQRCEEFRPIEYAAKFDGSAFVVFSSDEFPHLSSEQEEVVEFKVRTSAKYGLIIWQGQQPNSAEGTEEDDEWTGEDYLSIGLLDGHLSFSFELGGGAAQILSESPVDDGKTHSIRAIRRGRDGWLFVDEVAPTSGRSSGILAMLNVEGHVFVGGVPDLHEMTFGLHTQNFVGCLAELKLNGQKMDMMANAIDGRNVRPCRSWQPNRMRRRRKWMRGVRKQRKAAQRRRALGRG